MGSASGVPGRPYRIVVNGTTGSGKTTVSKRLAELLGLRHVELDAYRHGPNWAETPDALFRENLRAALSGDRWVADGNYSLARDVVWSRAATLVWLDYPINVVMWRLFWRTIRRGVTRQELERQPGEHMGALPHQRRFTIGHLRTELAGPLFQLAVVFDHRGSNPP